jgi:mRNA-degrading endonuclease toxin of MazEF toxin-antitoxin module
MTVGELVWVEFPAGAGRAQSGRRPAVIAQGAEASDQLPTVLVIPLTTQQDALRFPGTVLIETTGSNGLKQPSIALVFQITVLDRKFLGKRLGEVSEAVVQALWSAFDEITDRS